MTTTSLQCARCSVPITEQGSFWTEDGQVCQTCEQREILRASFLKTYKSSGYGALTTSIVALKFFDPFFAITVLAISSATWTFKAAMTRDELEREVVREHRGPLIAAGVGSLLVGLHILDISLGVLSFL